MSSAHSQTRRGGFLLDLLFEREGRTLHELDSELEMTRFGVMKHLRVLEEAGLVVTRRQGREKLHFLNPVPIRQVHDRWIDKYTEHRVLGAPRPQRSAGGDGMTTTVGTTDQVYELFIKASPERVWDAIINPEFTVQYFHGVRIEVTPERRLSGSADGSETWDENAVLEWDPPRRLSHEWHSFYDPELAAEEKSRVTWEIEAQDGGFSKLTVIHDRLENAPKTAASVSGAGWMMVLSGLKSVLETGEGLS